MMIKYQNLKQVNFGFKRNRTTSYVKNANKSIQKSAQHFIKRNMLKSTVRK